MAKYWGLASVCASGLLAAGSALAAPSLAKIITPPSKPAPPAPDDGLKGGGFYLEADTLIDDDGHQTVIAEGSVEARYHGRVLRADEVDYNRDSGVVTAHGHVVIINSDGTNEFAQSLTLDKDLTEGMAVGFSARLQDNVKIAAASSNRRDKDVTELQNVIFTPCQVCTENGAKTPTWSIRAKRVLEDHKKKTLYFHGAVVQVKGVSVLYLPGFAAPDPSSERRSGFLLPVASISGARGFSYEQPYYQVINSSADITVSPQINTKVNPFLNVDYRERFYSGVIDIRAGFTWDQDFTSGGAKFGPDIAHSYILGSGQFDLGSNWSWGFTAEQTSDKLIFEKYSVPDVYIDRGLYAADGGRLISQLDAVRQDSNSYLSIAAVDVQGLRPNDSQSTIPTVAPLIEFHYEPPDDILGGRLRIDASAVALTRDESQTLVNEPGIDSRRATAGFDWQTAVTLNNGLRIVPFVQGRVDLYNLDDLPPPTSPTATIARAFGDVGAEFSYPLIKQTTGATWILEPLAQVVVGPNTKLDPRIPDEDSQVWYLDETNLFETNRSPGYDLYEGGQNLTVGGRATVILPDGGSGSLLIGRVLQTQGNPNLPLTSGLRQNLSDWVIGLDGQIGDGVGFFSRWQMNSQNFGIQRMETGINFTSSRISGYVSYLQEAVSPLGGRVTSLDIHGEVWVTKHWGLDIYSIVDGGTWRQNDIGLVYRDDCLRVEMLYRSNVTYNPVPGPANEVVTYGPSSGFVIRLSLATLGNTR